jgi:hypothetical protein
VDVEMHLRGGTEAARTSIVYSVGARQNTSRRVMNREQIESRTDEKLRLMIAEAEAEADRNDGREPGDTRDEESLEDHNIQGLGAYRDVFDADGEQ